MFDEKSCTECALRLCPTLRKKIDNSNKAVDISLMTVGVLILILIVFSIIIEICGFGALKTFVGLWPVLFSLNVFIYLALMVRISLLENKAAKIWKYYIFLVEETGSSDLLREIKKNPSYLSSSSRYKLNNFNPKKNLKKTI